MTSDNRFKPPEAALDPSLLAPPGSRGPVIALALAGLLQVAWLARLLPTFYELVRVGLMIPVGPFVCLLGCACLYVAVLRALPAGVRGRNLFFASVVFLAGGLAILGAGGGEFDPLLLTTFYFAAVIGALGFALTWTRGRARRSAA